MNAPREEAVEFAKQSKRENRVYVGNLSYDVKYRDLMEFMRGGGWGHFRLAVAGFWSLVLDTALALDMTPFLVLVVKLMIVAAAPVEKMSRRVRRLG